MSKGVSSKITFKAYTQREQWLLPPSLEELVPAGHLVRSVMQFQRRNLYGNGKAAA